MITAKRKDGTPVEAGDKVLVRWNENQILFGRISEIGKPMTFSDFNFQRLQTYKIKCKDGAVRPAHARHIKKVF